MLRLHKAVSASLGIAVAIGLLFITCAPAPAQTSGAVVAQAAPPSTEMKQPPIPERSYWVAEITYSGYVGKAEFDLIRKDNEVSGKHHFASDYFNANNLKVTGTIEGNVLKLKIPGLAFGALDAVVDATGEKMTGTYVGRVGMPFPFEARRQK